MRKQRGEITESEIGGRLGRHALKVNLPQALLTKHEARRPTDNAYKKGAEISTNTQASSNFHTRTGKKKKAKKGGENFHAA